MQERYTSTAVGGLIHARQCRGDRALGVNPTVSVCVPAYNAAPYIAETVASVLGQTYDDFELVVVDDASTDGTTDVVAGFADPRVRLERNTVGLGVEGNWNRAVNLAKGRYVKLLCHDDTLRRECLATQVAVLETHPDVSMAAGRRDVIDEDGRVLIADRGLGKLAGVVAGSKAIRATVQAGTNLFGEPVCVLMRGERLAQCGPFSGARPYVIDLEYWCRLLKLGPLYAQPETVGAFRVALTSLSFQLSGRQNREVLALVRELRDGHPDWVRRQDVASGVLRSTALALGRAAAYRVLARHSRARASRKDDGG
jgi:glycosyltransferase involved in cell wall biosynthesis